eukprot:scaffold154296_cov31-Tisochrysis_lutea.AAC.2
MDPAQRLREGGGRAGFAARKDMGNMVHGDALRLDGIHLDGERRCDCRSGVAFARVRRFATGRQVRACQPQPPASGWPCTRT